MLQTGSGLTLAESNTHSTSFVNYYITQKENPKQNPTKTGNIFLKTQNHKA